MNAPWQTTANDRDAAIRVFTFLDERPDLLADVHMEDEPYCVQLAVEFANFLADTADEPERAADLVGALHAMRQSAAAFAAKSGPDCINFTRHGWPGADRFALALGELRALVGIYIEIIAYQFDIEIPAGLNHVRPPGIPT